MAFPLDVSHLKRTTRRRLERLLAKATSEEDLLRRATPADHELLRALLDRQRGQTHTPAHLGGSPASTSAPTPPPLHDLAFPSWLEATVPDKYLDLLLNELFVDDLAPHLAVTWTYWTLDQLITAALRGQRKARPLLERYLKHLAKRMQDARDRPTPWRNTSPHPHLDPAVEMLRHILDHAQHHVRPADATPLSTPEDVSIELSGEDLRLPSSHKLAFDMGTWDLYYREYEASRSPTRAIDAAASFLDFLTHPDFEAARAPFVQTYRQAPSLRTLQRWTTGALTVAADNDKPLIGWTLNEESGQVFATRCRPAKRGPNFVNRLDPHISPRDPAVADPRDQALLRATADAETPLRDTLPLLQGHPRIFRKSARAKRPIPLWQHRVALAARQTKDGATFGLEIDGQPLSSEYLIRFDDGVAWALTDEGVHYAILPRALLPMLRNMPHTPLSFTGPEQVQQLLARLQQLSPAVPLHIDRTLLGTPEQGDPRPLLVASWSGDALALDVRIAPTHDSPPQLPGEGPAQLFLPREGERAVVLRDLSTEPQTAQTLLDRTFGADFRQAHEVRPHGYSLSDTEAALDALQALRAARQDWQLRWDGAPPLAPTTATPADLSLSVGSGTDWFGLQGKLAAGDQDIDLAEAMRAASAGRRYLSLGEGRWVQLEDRVRKHLTTLQAVQDKQGLNALHGGLLHAMSAEGVNVHASEDWLTRRAAADAAPTLQVAVPSDIQATLRPYQAEGFLWLARLASWAPGAVLADDMGLGKTLQSLCLLVHRRTQGPALVVAPTSVVDNWAAEAAKFAPTLTVGIYRGSGRARQLEDPPDLVITSYALFARDAEALGEDAWGTIVLDEAHAIRNPTTQRAKAAHRVKAGFRLALTGTPLQNRTEDLWSLMTFAAPGLLGSAEGFRTRFAHPIRAGLDNGRRALLAELLAPFVLRRTKGMVATDLPPRVEQTLTVTLSDEEQALYTASRDASVQRLLQAGKQRGFQMLQELTRLRQLACHPSLVDASSTVPSSKLRTIVRLLHDLKDAGHAALVFSSFTSHLALVREALAATGMQCRYLDGSTPAGRRADEVAAFQAGEGDAFLISLKAGGTGLNLTRATYVLHIDPWWNPAAEDQASDRAHRIGQTQPVTVYRLVSQGTIEEQILALHDAKRNLAKDVLSGAASTALPSTDELMALLQRAKHDDDDPVQQAVVALAATGATAPQTTTPTAPTTSGKVLPFRAPATRVPPPAEVAAPAPAPAPAPPTPEPNLPHPLDQPVETVSELQCARWVHALETRLTDTQPAAALTLATWAMKLLVKARHQAEGTVEDALFDAAAAFDADAPEGAPRHHRAALTQLLNLLEDG